MFKEIFTESRSLWKAELYKDGEVIEREEAFDDSYPAKFLRKLEKKWKAKNSKVINKDKLIKFTK
jgi:hypothetical protein